MLNDLPADIEVLDNLDISKLDPMMRDYVFSSYFLARLITKTTDENKALKRENAALRAQVEECAELKKRIDALKTIIDEVGELRIPEAAAAVPEEAPAAEAEEPRSDGFMAVNRANIRAMAEQAESEIAAVPAPDAIPSAWTDAWSARRRSAA